MNDFTTRCANSWFLCFYVCSMILRLTPNVQSPVWTSALGPHSLRSPWGHLEPLAPSFILDHALGFWDPGIPKPTARAWMASSLGLPTRGWHVHCVHTMALAVRDTAWGEKRRVVGQSLKPGPTFFILLYLIRELGGVWEFSVRTWLSRSLWKYVIETGRQSIFYWTIAELDYLFLNVWALGAWTSILLWVPCFSSFECRTFFCRNVCRLISVFLTIKI